MSETKEKKEKKVQNHYLAGKLEWAEMYGSIIQERNFLRMVSLASLCSIILLGAVLIIEINKDRVVPWVVEVDRAGRVSGTVSATKMQTTTQQIQYGIATFITYWRTVTADIALQEKYIEQASFMSVKPAKRILAEWYGKNNPYVKSELDLIEVRMTGLPLFISGNTWLVEWEEIERTHDGVEEGRKKYQANITIVVKHPETDDEILRNASGIYITEISHSRKITQKG